MPTRRIAAFHFQPGERLAGKYEIVDRLGGGYEGESYLLRECSTRVERVGKLFFPHRNPRDRAANRYARNLHKLRDCPAVIGYHARERLEVDGVPVTFLLSEYVRGEPLRELLDRQPGRRLTLVPALHLLHALARGLEPIHQRREYHGDLHTGNIVVEHFGLTFKLKLVDLYDRGPFSRGRVEDDVCDMIRIFYDSLGGRARYANLPKAAKDICRGLKRSLILERFRSARQLVGHLEELEL